VGVKLGVGEGGIGVAVGLGVLVGDGGGLVSVNVGLGVNVTVGVEGFRNGKMPVTAWQDMEESTNTRTMKIIDRRVIMRSRSYIELTMCAV